MCKHLGTSFKKYSFATLNLIRQKRYINLNAKNSLKLYRPLRIKHAMLRLFFLINLVKLLRVFYNGIGQDDSLYNFKNIAQSSFHAKIFVNNC